MKIGFQGDIGSNSEIAAQKLAEKFQFQNISFVPLINSQNVVNALSKKQVDYGVMATKNIIAGDVEETLLALTPNIELIDTITLPIHHFLFKKNKTAQIKYVASHIQALKQTQETRKKLFSFDVKEVECSDTALAAKMLSDGIYPDSYGVICREETGKMFQLTLVAKNIEDDKTNQTFFGLFKLKEQQEKI